jgi:hypothetical protein
VTCSEDVSKRCFCQWVIHKVHRVQNRILETFKNNHINEYWLSVWWKLNGWLEWKIISQKMRIAHVFAVSFLLTSHVRAISEGWTISFGGNSLNDLIRCELLELIDRFHRMGREWRLLSRANKSNWLIVFIWCELIELIHLCHGMQANWTDWAIHSDLNWLKSLNWFEWILLIQWFHPIWTHWTVSSHVNGANWWDWFHWLDSLNGFLWCELIELIKWFRLMWTYSGFSSDENWLNGFILWHLIELIDQPHLSWTDWHDRKGSSELRWLNDFISDELIGMILLNVNWLTVGSECICGHISITCVIRPLRTTLIVHHEWAHFAACEEERFSLVEWHHLPIHRHCKQKCSWRWANYCDHTRQHLQTIQHSSSWVYNCG